MAKWYRSVEATERLSRERRARLAAERLIPLRSLLEAVTWSQDREEVAHELGVDAPMLAARERGLSRQERGRLRRASRLAVVPGA